MKYKSFLCLLLVALIALATTVSAVAESNLPCRIYLPGAIAGDEEEFEKVLAAVNQSLHEQGYNIDVTVTYIGWDAWSDKINLMLASGDEFELFEIAEDIVMRTEYYSRGALTVLDPLLKEYGQNILGLFTDEQLDPVRIGGNIIAIPADWLSTAMDDWFSMPKDYFELTGMEIPTNIDELIALLRALKEKVPGENNYAQLRTVFNPWYLWRDFENYPFWVDLNRIFHVTQDGEVSAFVETDVFKRTCEIMHQLYTEKLISPDVLTIGGNMDSVIKEINAGRALMYFTFYYSGFPKAEDANQVMEAVNFKLRTDRPHFAMQAFSNALGVSITSPHPEAGVMFLDWLYKNQENHNLFLLGIEGEHWTRGEGNTYTRAVNENGAPLYNVEAWQFGNRKYELYLADNNTNSSVAGTDVELADFAYTDYADKDTELSITLGFNFDPEPVYIEYNNVITEIQASMLPIMFGVVPYEDGFETALSNVKAAGLDAVIAEYDRQFQEYLSNK